jgi:hypothetical protein
MKISREVGRVSIWVQQWMRGNKLKYCLGNTIGITTVSPQIRYTVSSTYMVYCQVLNGINSMYSLAFSMYYRRGMVFQILLTTLTQMLPPPKIAKA